MNTRKDFKRMVKIIQDASKYKSRDAMNDMVKVAIEFFRQDNRSFNEERFIKNVYMLDPDFKDNGTGGYV